VSQPLNRSPLRRLLFAGEAIVDLLMWVPALPERGGDMLSESAAIEVGGGFNVMAAAVRQGLPVLYCGGHGTGPWGEKVRAALAAENIGLLRAPDPDLDTGFDVALVEAGGERTFITHLGAESLREPDAWNLVRARPGDAVYVSGYGLVPPASGAILGAWAAALPPDVLLFVDPGPLRLVELQPARSRPAHRHHRPGRSGPPPGQANRPRRRHRPGWPGRRCAGPARGRRVRPDGPRPVAQPHPGSRGDGGRHDGRGRRLHRKSRGVSRRRHPRAGSPIAREPLCRLVDNAGGDPEVIPTPSRL